MNNQESMFADREEQAYRPQPINKYPREQSSEQRQWHTPPQQEGYRETYDGPQRNGEKIRPQRRRRRIPILVIVLLILIVAIGGIAYAFTSFKVLPSTTTTHNFVINSAQQSTLVMNIGSGAIHVHTGGSTVIIKETESAGGFVASTTNASYNQNGNQINVDDNSNGVVLGFRNSDFDVTVPSTSDLQLQTGSGAVDISNINGQVDAQTGSGSISVNNISGQRATLKTGSGSIDANNVSEQQSTLHTGSGSIKAQRLSGEVTLDTGSGSVTVTQAALRGNSSLKTGSASVNYQGSLDPHGSYLFETGSGSVNLTLPASSAFDLSTSTDSGRVNNSFGSDNVGNDPRAPLSIHTGSGSINLNEGS